MSNESNQVNLTIDGQPVAVPAGTTILSAARELGGEIPINTSGGLKARGNPIGATGIAQAVEIVAQLRGKADKRQVKDAEVGISHNVGGTGATAVVTVFRRLR